MPAFLERKLKDEYGAGSSIPYKIMNKEGFMKGNKETKKGRNAEKKHKLAKKMHPQVKMMHEQALGKR